MNDAVVVSDVKPMGQVERVVDTFVAPSKTFTDILRSSSCWLPLVLMVLMTVVWSYAIDKKVGYDTVAANQMAKASGAQADAMQNMKPAERGQMMQRMAMGTRVASYASMVLVVIFMLVESLILWGVFNFGMGASTKFGQVFAVVSFAGLARSLVWVISTILLFANVGTDNFNMQNPVGTNLGFYLQDSPKWMSTAGTFVDVFGIWSLVLLAMGMGIISKKKFSTSATVIFGIWFVILLIVAGASAAMS